MRSLAWKAVSALHKAVYRASGGRVLGRIRGVPVLLLTTTGRKSGRARSTPLLYVPDADAYVLAASNGGRPSHPSWYRNLEHQPAAKILVGNRTLTVRATVASQDERARLWDLLTSRYPPFAAYQRKTSRRIPVVTLRPDDS